MVLHIRKVGKLAQLWEGIWSCFWLVHCPFPSTEMCYLSCQHLACITFSTSSCPSLRLHSSRNKSDGGVPQVFTSLANDHFILNITHYALKCWSLRGFYFKTWIFWMYSIVWAFIGHGNRDRAGNDARNREWCTNWPLTGVF